MVWAAMVRSKTKAEGRGAAQGLYRVIVRQVGGEVDENQDT